ncbi:SpoIIE family protein phosphatase [Selenomonas sp. FC4001]|uniref:SpoIIE family protein phosphatase n=1 Tax=Selenomonas sp. FC4001 TaxID=1408313 RepID=UPI00068EBB9C|nr:SpoIIE family protein phosphatase [Selenomonas sp. FC4001]
MVKLSIRGRVLLLLLASVLITLMAVGGLAFYALNTTKITMLAQSEAVGQFLAESMGRKAASDAKNDLQEMTRVKAQHLSRELMMVKKDVAYMADSLQLIMTSPAQYRPRKLPDTQQEPDILSETVYIHYSPELQSRGIDGNLQRQIALAGNFADVLEPLSKYYRGYRTSLYAGSRDGYFICLDIVPSEQGRASIYPSPEVRQDFIQTYDHRERFWYKLGEQTDTPAFSDIYRGAEGKLDVTCAMPYYDGNGFAGVVGISYSVEDLYRTFLADAIKQDGISFVMDCHGRVVFSSEDEGILAARLDGTDIRQLSEAEPDIAAAAQRMVAGGNDVMSVIMNGKKYYLAFAPLEGTKWSFGTMLEAQTVMTPVERVKDAVLEKMTELQTTGQSTINKFICRSAILLIPILLLLIYSSGLMAGRLTRPIRQLEGGVREIAAGNFDKKLQISTGDEIENLAESVNSMSDDLKLYTENLAQVAAEKERSRTELEVAAQIQQDMLPGTRQPFPERQEFSIYALMQPARDVGGDFYDFYIVQDNYLVVTIADVSGKGVPAALFMAKCQSVLKSCIMGAKSPENLGAILEKANRELCQNNEAAMFVTVLVGVLDLRNGHFTYAHCGHCPPLLQHEGHYEFLPLPKSYVLGLWERPYTQKSMELSPGDMIFLYTDGVSEAMDVDGNLFTEPRIRDTLNNLSAERQPEKLLPQMLAAIRQYAGGEEQSDDITMVGLRYDGQPEK